MGGTFDPIHHGHLVAASEVQALFDLDEVVFVPTGRPWQKDDSQVTAAEHRYLMTVIATASNPRFSVSRVDIQRDGPTYTIDTLRDLRRLNPEAELFFITGADALSKILSWKDSHELWDLAHFIGVTRPGYVLSESGLPADGVTLTEVPAMAISSTDVRKRVAAGKPVWYLVPDGVVQHINKYHLYAPTPPDVSADPTVRVTPAGAGSSAEPRPAAGQPADTSVAEPRLVEPRRSAPDTTPTDHTKDPA